MWVTEIVKEGEKGMEENERNMNLENNGKERKKGRKIGRRKKLG